MKTIDLLVQALQAIGGWPEKVTHIGQDYDRELMFYGRGNVRSGIFLDQLAADHRKHGEKGTKITREQYEAALAAKNEGWIEWGGGEYPPVSTNAVVDVKLRCGSVTARQPAGAMNWQVNAPGDPGDIIAYRLRHPQEAEQAEAYDEVDLNECIGQDAAPVWNGEGLPPVGCECECQFRGEWQKCTILFSGKQIVVVMVGDDEYPFESKGLLFRPIRSEAERKRDDICDKIYGAMTNAKRKDNRSDMAEEIYDAIAAGKIPGLRLED